ncbi:DUF1493 family protein [Pectobacterium zantedeschiae]|uniref:DUF1493 family protein n=1 Tax=Pectobacterium zantedeschiae TaxID=2034769 RepID=A0A9X8P5A1_9GAMM|nr:DUF1493 family protein [Pectobacterium zantedeschiae]RYC39700.1 acyl carrier protein [Pectobacterium zantedeschiae]RYC44368.1 DUF1493 family protein [Pectobacterium zantedeschiae]RYC49527.1 acyl carrier protein [Pectobacterium zantedeschiae]
MVDAIEKRIYELIEPWNGITWSSLKIKPLAGETSLNHSMNMDPIEAADLLLEVFEEFSLNFDDLNFQAYFTKHRKDEKPLTINMLIASAKAGRWLYD